MKIFTCAFVPLLLFASANGQTHRQKYGYVPDSSTAIKVAEAVLIPVYGKKLVESERPFNATLEDGIWTVGGTLYCGDGKPQSTHSPSCVGGVAVVKISRKDACILFMTHYR